MFSGWFRSKRVSSQVRQKSSIHSLCTHPWSIHRAVQVVCQSKWSRVEFSAVHSRVIYSPSIIHAFMHPSSDTARTGLLLSRGFGRAPPLAALVAHRPLHRGFGRAPRLRSRTAHCTVASAAPWLWPHRGFGRTVASAACGFGRSWIRPRRPACVFRGRSPLLRGVAVARQTLPMFLDLGLGLICRSRALTIVSLNSISLPISAHSISCPSMHILSRAHQCTFHLMPINAHSLSCPSMHMPSHAHPRDHHPFLEEEA